MRLGYWIWSRSKEFVGSESAEGGGCTTRSRRVPPSRCILFLEESRTVPCEPSDVGVYTFRSGRPKAPLLSGVKRPSEVNSPSATGAAASGVRSEVLGDS